MIRAIILSALVLWPHTAPAQTFTITGLSAADLRLIGRGLDKLPREETDEEHGALYARIQAQITQQANAMAKAKADAERAVLEKAIAAALDKAKADAEKESPQ